MVWSEMYDRLLVYKEAHNGSTDVQMKNPECNRLREWVQTQRKVYRQGDLSIVRIAMLESIGGFKWKREVVDKAWMQIYRRLVAYKEKYGDTLVPQNFNKDIKLGRWVGKQRRVCIDKDRIELLNKIGFTWNAKLDRHWQRMYKRLEAYTKEHGTACVKRTNADRTFANWVERQRRVCRGKIRVDLLNAIGFEWNPQNENDENWVDMYQRLIAFTKRYGSPRIRKQSCTGERQLVNWVHQQRQFCIQVNRVRLLDGIGFVWNVRDEWDDMYDRLLEYNDKHGNPNVPEGCEEDPQLANWVANQRYSCEREDRIELLNEIGFVWCRKQGKLLSS
jgi:hypothetical protein